MASFSLLYLLTFLISISPLVAWGVQTPCIATYYTQIPSIIASCTDIILLNLFFPSNESLTLSPLLTGTTVTFVGATVFGFTNSSTFVPITISGSNITITATPGSLIYGNGPLYWDGLGSNGGLPKPNYFVNVIAVTNNSYITNFYIENYPAHCFAVVDCDLLTIDGITLDNRAGNAPNDRSNGLAAAHNTDGFGLFTTNNSVVKDCVVWNQDDCVAVTSGDNVTVEGMFCDGSHGLSIGSIGGKRDNVVTNIRFQDSIVQNSQNGARIKTNYNTTGYVANITWSGIRVENITKYGIDVQQDYLNGGPTGDPSNGVLIENILFENITGTCGIGGTPYYVLCGDGSCRNITFVDVDIEGGTKESMCNYPPEGCPNYAIDFIDDAS